MKKRIHLLLKIIIIHIFCNVFFSFMPEAHFIVWVVKGAFAPHFGFYTENNKAI